MTSPSSTTLRWLFVILWMGIIFLGSSDFGSAAHTDSFIQPFLRWLFQGRLSVERMDDIHFAIRKTWHLLEYAILGLLLWNAFSAGRSPRRAAVASLVTAALYAASDEFHQSFIPSRSASVHDVLIDTVGASLGLAALWAIDRRRLKRAGANRPLPDKS